MQTARRVFGRRGRRPLGAQRQIRAELVSLWRNGVYVEQLRTPTGAILLRSIPMARIFDQ